jgi:hypothetical protein
MKIDPHRKAIREILENHLVRNKNLEDDLFDYVDEVYYKASNIYTLKDRCVVFFGIVGFITVAVIPVVMFARLVA